MSRKESTLDCGRPEDGMCVGACEPGMCWAEPLGEACDHWKREAESARAEVVELRAAIIEHRQRHPKLTSIADTRLWWRAGL